MVSSDTFLDAIEPFLTEKEFGGFPQPGIVATGLVNGVETYVLVEVSSTGDTNDVVRAGRRAGKCAASPLRHTR